MPITIRAFPMALRDLDLSWGPWGSSPGSMLMAFQ